MGTLLLFVAVVVLEAFTMYVLAKFAERYDAASYGTLIRRALGRKTGAALSAVTVVYLWGSSLAYLVGCAVQFLLVGLCWGLGLLYGQAWCTWWVMQLPFYC